MAERLADMLRTQDTRGGFEATADMLSITGMTLEQFANLMEGLGYRAEKAERVKVKVAPVEAPKAEVADEAAVEVAAPEAETEAAPEEAAPVVEDAPEMEVFYTFAWGARRPERKPNASPAKGKPRGKGKPGAKGQRRDDKAKSFQARPPKKEKPIDPDNPFAAALMGLKTK
ncbi:MAG: disulfide oxidoreductase, partial [Planktomarina sp.]